MKPVLSRAQMRDFDAYVISQCRVPGLVLMENAGRGATDVIEKEALGGAAAGKRVVVVCGGGNNGGDGYVIARHLTARGASVAVFSTQDVARLQGDALVNHDGYVGIGGDVRSLVAAGAAGALQLDEELARADAVVDALFGTGLDRPLTPESIDVVSRMNRAPGRRIAVDIPSGLDADTGAVHGTVFEASLTVTFGHPKLGLLTPRGARYGGTLRVVDLGVPPLLGPALAPSAELFEPKDLAASIRPRSVDSYKNTAGHVAVFAGSSGKVGAALMVAHAALRSGAGLATIVSWDDTAPVVSARVTEEMTASLARGPSLGESIDRALTGKKAVVAGPGFGTDADAHAAVSALLDRWKGPALYDADALTLFAGRPEAFATAKGPCVLSPHAGEAARLLGTTSEAIEADRYGAARRLAAKAQAVVVLKGAHTLIADPAGRVVVSGGVNPALGTAGSGDTLSGIVGALLCTLPAFDAACAAVFIHARAADMWSASHGDRGLLAHEIGDRVPDVLAAALRESAQSAESPRTRQRPG